MFTKHTRFFNSLLDKSFPLVSIIIKATASFRVIELGKWEYFYSKKMALYPGLGLPLRHYPRDFEKYYPLGIEASDGCSAVLPVREVAMMNIMEQLTDKENWHIMAFDDEIVDQWRKEALERPNRVYWKQATDNKGVDAVDWVRRPPGIMDVATFDYVCLAVEKSLSCNTIC